MTRDLNKLFGLQAKPTGLEQPQSPAWPTPTEWARQHATLSFTVPPEVAAAAQRINRRPQNLMMTPVDWRDDLMPEVVMTQIKWDGIHTGYRPDQPYAFTREGVDMLCANHLRPGLSAITERLRAMFSGEWAVFGEYVHPDGFDGAVSDFRRGTGTGCLQLFDAVPLDVYEGRAPSLSLFTRLKQLGAAAAEVGRERCAGVAVTKSQLFMGEARDNIIPMMDRVWELGLEGIVAKNAASPYVRSPSSHWLRIKRRQTVDLMVVDVVTHADGTLKSIVVQCAGSARCNVGVGFSAAQRRDPNAFRGKVVELRHLGITSGGRLRSPYFLRIRSDKES